jgi:hypothetical protein
MNDDITNPNARATVTGLLLRALRAIDNKIFWADDCRARDHGWQIIPRHGCLSRGYRDPRFDRLTVCTVCNGRGGHACGSPCSACHGAGRILLGSSAVSRLGRGQP